MLTGKKYSDDPKDPLRRTTYGWDEHASDKQNWNNNRGYWVLGARARRESYVLFSYSETKKVVMAAEIIDIVDAPGKPGKRIIEGDLLPADHPVYRAYVGQDTPDSARVRNPVTYLDSDVGGWLCKCGCGTEIHSGDFVRGHEQVALHKRVAEIGTIPDFIRWFDAVRSGESVAAKPARIMRDGRLDFTAQSDGSLVLSFTPST